MVLLVDMGLLFAPASHAGALFPGVMPLMVAILAAAVLKERFTPQKTGGLFLIASGYQAASARRTLRLRNFTNRFSSLSEYRRPRSEDISNASRTSRSSAGPT